MEISPFGCKNHGVTPMLTAPLIQHLQNIKRTSGLEAGTGLALAAVDFVGTYTQ